MSGKEEVRQFLMSRRAGLTPAEVGIPVVDDDRRVPGLRREEVAMLAGVSVDHYTRVEKGNVGGVSDSVLGAIATALRLTDVEREHLFDLARTAPLVPAAAERTETSTSREALRRLVESIAMPAIVQTPQLDLVAANHIARALFEAVFDDPRGANFARFNYLDPRARDFYADWPLARRTGAAILRLEAGRDPLNEELTALIGELSTLSPYFRDDWARRDVHEHRTGVKHFRHPRVGALELAFRVLETPGDSAHRLVTYSAEPGSETAERLAILAGIAAESAEHPARKENP